MWDAHPPFLQKTLTSIPMPPFRKPAATATKELPTKLKAYGFHGVGLSYKEGHDNAQGDCPLCGKDGKFFASPETGMWDCKSCGRRGNIYTFLRHVYEQSVTSHTDYAALAKTKGILNWDVLQSWGLVKSVITGDWLMAGYGFDKKMNQLYKYSTDPETGRNYFAVTPGTNHQIFGLGVWDLNKPDVHVMEGPWDGMAWYEALRAAKRTDTGLTVTSNEQASLLKDVNVIAVPSCNVFPEAWAELVTGKNVTFMYDSDHPKKQDDMTKPPVGYEGMRKACSILICSEFQPGTLQVISWGKDGYDPALKSGYDVRDALTTSGPLITNRLGAVEKLLKKVEPIPHSWATARSESAKKNGTSEIELLDCTTWKELRNQCLITMKWTEGLDTAFAVMFACVTSTMCPDSQLWCKIIGPASSGKTTLIEAIATNKKYTLSRSTIRGFHSGYKAEDGEDVSLAAQVNGKSLLTKDGDTLLQAPNLGQILSEARDIYDGDFRTSYRNGVSREGNNIRMTWILCGTESLRDIDSSELGERFLDCVIMEGIDDEFEDEVLWKVINRADRNMSMGKAENRTDEDRLKMMQLAGGYVKYLRENAEDLLAQVGADEEQLRQIIKLGKFVAHMRARPSKMQTETAGREFGARLVEQHLRLAKCLAVVLNKTTLDEDVMKRVKKVSMDTSRGVTMEIAKHLFKAEQNGVRVEAMAMYTNQKKERVLELLRFLRQIGVVEFFQRKVGNMNGEQRWRLTTRMTDLYRAVGAPII